MNLNDQKKHPCKHTSQSIYLILLQKYQNSIKKFLFQKL